MSKKTPDQQGRSDESLRGRLKHQHYDTCRQANFYPPHLAEHKRQKFNCCKFVSTQGMWYTEQESCRNTGNKSCRCGRGSVSRAEVTAVHGEAETDASSLAVSYSLCCFQTGSTSTSRSSPVVLNADWEPGLWWNWVMHTQRCPRLCCLACSCFSRRAQGCCLIFFIYSLPPRWLSSDKAKKESVISPGLSSASQSKKDEGIFSVFSKS